MTQEEKNLKRKEVQNKILELKILGKGVVTRETIQKLQQELDELAKHES